MDALEASFRLSNVYWRAVTKFYFRPQFGFLGDRTLIRRPLLIRNARFIHIGSRCGIRDFARLEVVLQPESNPILEIGDDTTFEQGVHIGCSGRIKIGSKVTFSYGCGILDYEHPYQDVRDSTPVGRRMPSEPGFVEICDGAFIGAGSIVLANVTIGERCVVGANSVVNRSLPSYTVCAGNPAQVIRRYDWNQEEWRREQLDAFKI